LIIEKSISPAACDQIIGDSMKRTSAICAAIAVMGLLAKSAQAEISAEAARASVAPFYKALNAQFANDSPELIKQSTAPQWVSYLRQPR
jgi:hypothetical protein